MINIQDHNKSYGGLHVLKNINLKFEQGKTVIISSHIFSTLSDTCDEIHLLKEGEFVKRVFRDEFKDLEKEMKEITVGDKIERLGLR